MSNKLELVKTHEKNMIAVESALVRNDISQLTTQERLTYYNQICESVGLNPLTKPFSFLKLQGKEVLYANKDCTEQLRKIHGVSTQIISRGVVGDLFEVHVKAKDKTGKEDEDIAYVVIKGLSGAELANAMLKTVTKAKRRVTLSICGLGILDESELDTVKDVTPAPNPQIQSQFIKEAKEIEQEPEPELQAQEQLQPEENALPDFENFVISFGQKMYGRKLSDFTVNDHKGMIGYLENGSAKTGKPIDGHALDYYNIARLYISSKG